MLGYFKVINNEGVEIGRYKYNSITNQQKRALKNMKDITLYCCCGDEDIEMKISSDLRIYPANQNVGQQHEKGCPKYIYPKKEELWTRQETESHIYYHVAASYAVADDYAIKVNTLTYDRLIEPEYRLPDNFEDFNKRLNATLKYIKTPAGEILYNISIVGKKLNEIPVNKEIFVYGMLTGKPIIKTYGKKQVLFLDVKDCNGYTRRYYANMDVYREQTSKIYKGYRNIVVCGFAYKKSANSKMLTLSDYCVKAIGDVGTFISL